MLQTTANIALIIFTIIYTLRILIPSNKFDRKHIFKNTLEKYRIDICSMEFNQVLMDQDRKLVESEIEQKLNQLNEYQPLLVDKENEFEAMKAEKGPNWDECVAKGKEILELKEKIGEEKKDKKGEIIETTGLLGEIDNLRKGNQWIARKYEELMKQIIQKQRVLDRAKEIMAELLKK